MPIQVSESPFLQFVDVNTALEVVEGALDSNLLFSGTSFTLIACQHYVHGKCVVLLSSVGPNIIFTSKGK